MNAYVPRGFKILISNQDPNFMNLVMEFPIIRKVYQEIFNKTLTLMQSGKIKDITKFSIILNDSTELKVVEYRDQYCNDIFNKYKFSSRTTTFQRELLTYVLKNIRGYWKRNGQQSSVGMNNPRCSFKGRTINTGETTGYIDGKFKIVTRSGAIKVDIHKIISKYPLEKMQRVGGNLQLKFKKGKPIVMFVGFIEKFEAVKYEPKDFIAFDVNKTKQYYLTFSDGNIIERSDEIQNLLDIKDTLNLIIKPPKVDKEVYDQYKTTPINVATVLKGMKAIEEYNPVWARYIQDKIDKSDGKYFCIISKQRRNIRGYHERCYKHIKKLLRKIAVSIIQKAEENQMGIAIDNITTGAKMKEYGQHISRIFIEECRNRKIPYYTIPSGYTTQMCNECKFKDKKNKIDSDNFKCIKCGNESVTHKNASKNIHDIAIELFENGCLYGAHEGRSVKQVLKNSKNLENKMNGIKIKKQVIHS